MADMRLRVCPAIDFAIAMVDKPKPECGEESANAGFFGPYSEGGDAFTLPGGHLVCDYEADSKWVEFYCKDRGNFDAEGRIRFDNSSIKNSPNNNLYGKCLSTLVVKDGKASIIDTVELPECDYAISGVPVLRNGADCKWGAYVTKQGWSANTVRATWHIFAGVKDDHETVYVMGMETKTDNMVQSSEAYNIFKAMGFRDVIKLDGGMSFYFDSDGVRTDTGGNRRLNSIIKFKKKTEGADGDMFKLALGAGHGKGTAGKRCMKALDPNETREWVLNDRICDYIESYLKDYDGYRLLRLDDSDDGEEDVALAARTKEANAWGADFYLSVHHNAGVNGGSGGGIVAYTHPDASMESVEWRNALYQALIEHTGLKGNRATPKATSNLYVLRKTVMPAVLLELGFMDSKTDVPIILTNEYAQNCAKAIVEVIVRRANLSKKDEVATKSWVREYVASLLK